MTETFGGGGLTVNSVSVKVALPPGPVAVQIQVVGNPTHAAMAAAPTLLPLTVARVPLITCPVPVEVQLNVTAVAFVVLQVSVLGSPTILGEGTRLILMVGSTETVNVWVTVGAGL